MFGTQALLADAVNRRAVSLQGDSASSFSIFAPRTPFPLVPHTLSFQSPLALSLTQQPLRPSQASTVLVLHPEYQILSHELAACFLLGTNKSLSGVT